MYVLDRLVDVLISDVTLLVYDYQGDFTFPPQSHLLRRLLETGAYEPELARLFTSLVEPHLDVIDVGANIGLFTVLAGKRLGTGRVLAAEPTDGAFSRLTANVKNHGVSGRVILYKGLIAQSGRMGETGRASGGEKWGR